jgi:acylphosphatase
MAAFEEVEAIVSGKVQRVGFRDFAQGAATTLALVGFVENCADGTVRVVAQGEPEQLRLFVGRLHEGSTLAQVEQVAVSWRAPTAPFDDFSIIF